jgi:hypothetical protein
MISPMSFWFEAVVTTDMSSSATMLPTKYIIDIIYNV